MTGDFLKVAKWTNPDTAVFWAFAADVEAGALFELESRRSRELEAREGQSAIW
jgi:hypothetical protein